MNKEVAVSEIAELVARAEDAIRKAEALADEHGLEFSFSPAYGMGGYYVGAGADNTWSEQGWNPSSMSC